MRVTIDRPDDIAASLAGRNGADLPRSVLEAVALEGYRSRQLTHAQVGRPLGIDYRFDVDAFLKERGAYLQDTPEDLEPDRETLGKLDV